MPDLDTHLHHHPVAIVGMGAIMPQAHSLREFWNNIVGKVDCISDVPESRWRIEDYYDPDPTASDKTYCKRGGFIPDVDFDPMEFGLPPNILEVTDVSQMLSLLVAKEALTDAGYAQGADDIRERTGVILGVGGGQKLITPLTARLQYPIWDEVLQSYGISDEDRPQIIERMKLAYIRWEENSFPGMLGNVIAGRIANRFDLGGTNCVVDAACASTLAALRMAVSELTEHRADMMLTGGVDTDNSIFMYMCFSKTPAFSKCDNPRPFDTESDGMLMGEGIGMMVLKRLADAERDGDRIYAVIKGIGSSSDGRYKSIYAPRGEGQEKALRRAYEDAGISPATVGLVEAHGTGTVAGDTTEVTTIVRYFNQHDSRKQHVALGSVKSQIGHTKASAGAAGMIKTALAIYHKILPPTLNVEQPNPKFDLPNSAFYVNTEARPWVQTADKLPRRAGVSSFGFGGTNFHVVLEEYRSDHHSAYRVHSTPQAIILTAGTPAELLSHLESALTGVRSDDGERIFLNLVRASRTVNVPAAAARIGFVAATSVEAAAMLQIAHDMLTGRMTAADWQHPKGVFYRRSALNVDGHVVALFPGQGAQYLGMGRELLLNFPEMRQSFARLDSLMAQDGKAPLSDVVFPPRSFQTNEVETQEAVLQGTDYAQPAIGAFSAGLYRLLYKAGFRASVTAGHSFGELTALWAAGVLDDDSFDVLVKARGAAMAPPPDVADFDAGTMMAVTGDIDAIEREIDNLPGVQMANRNSRSQVVVAGAKDAVKSAEAVLKEKG
ncbi:MAG: beta-ketoacyl synthase N-terminal-like domain-containing protein, partial [Chloroflexota bacterium]